MIPSILIVLVVLAFTIVFFLAAQVRLRYSRRNSLAAQARELTPVDIDAFENLTDTEEEEFLRTSLSPSEFRGVQRSRIRAAKLYVAALSQNAGILVAIGQTARLNPDTEIAAAGQELMQKAIQLRLWCLVSYMRMEAAFFFPVLVSPTNRLANQYMLVSYMAASLPGRAAA
ncbi:MAG TPA: hypothetical protein VMT67_08615 [Terriglobales bacterium]|nr:hypothetical protein [Terriglobales bacterium]